MRNWRSRPTNVAAHVLCRQGPIEPGGKVVDVGAMYLRGGTPAPDARITNLKSLTSIERRSKRVGPRYASFVLDSGDIEECALACVRDRECRSWSGWEGRSGRCFLSSRALSATPVDYSFAYSGRIGAMDVTVEPEAPGPGTLNGEPVSGTTDAIAAAIKASDSGEHCRGADVLRPFLDDPRARSLHRKLRAACE